VLLLGVASGTMIKDAATVVTYSRGFGNDEIRDVAMSRDEIHAALREMRHVIVNPPSFLQFSMDDGETVVDTHTEELSSNSRQVHHRKGPVVRDAEFVAGSGGRSHEIQPDQGFQTVAERVAENYKSRGANLEEERKRMHTRSQFPALVDNGWSIDSDPLGYAAKGKVDPNEMTMKIGPLQLHVIKRLQSHSLIRSVKWGTSAVPPWTADYPVKRRPDEVHQHIISFDGEPFVTRPIVLVTVMPICDGDPNKCDELWTDVFAVSLSAISTNDFAVNIIRVDSLPNNTWGQTIHIAYVAFEPNDARAAAHDRVAGNNDAHLTMFTV